ncbi:flagellar basal-body rod protein FlgF [Pseudomonadota bacterium]
METTSYIALSRQGALRREMSAIANNLANMNTTAFKNERLMFVDYMAKSRTGDFIADQRLAFVRDVASYRDTTEGPIEQTGNPLDLAIHGEGNFVVQGLDGTEQYTRNGSLRLDNTGQLVTQNGLSVLTDAGTPVFFAPEDTTITISGDGTVSTENGQIGKLRIVTFDNPQDMQRLANGLYTSTQPPVDMVDPQITQAALEKSNVQAITEMTRMIEVNRSYNRANKMIEKEDERIRKMVRELASTIQA